jgi:uncharacterized protein YdaT
MMNENRDNQTNRDVVDPTLEREENEQSEHMEEQKAESPSVTTTDDELEALFEEEESDKFRTQWLNIQSKFVDNPRESVREADELVANILKSVTMGFHHRRTSLEKQWNSGNDISTEDLRLALKRYRSFFDRLLTLES